MARPLRIEYPGAWHHIMNRGRRAERIFADKPDYANFITILKETVELWNLRVAAYCLMPNHYHLLVQTPDANMARCMRHINGVYTQRYNRIHQVDGQLFRGRYKSILVDADSYLLQLIRYIHRNPVRAGLTETLEGYEWSSHRGYLSNAQRWKWLHKEKVLSMLSQQSRGRLKAYATFMHMEDELKILGVFKREKWPSMLGSEAFSDWIKEKFFPEKIHDEIPQSRELTPEPERIKKAVCDFYQVGENELTGSRRGFFNEPRNVAIYLIRRLRGDSLREIGGLFHMRKYSSVSSVIERVKAALSTDRSMRERVDKIVSNINKSQEQT